VRAAVWSARQHAPMGSDRSGSLSLMTTVAIVTAVLLAMLKVGPILCGHVSAMLANLLAWGHSG
jgi:hypothetical protein